MRCPLFGDHYEASTRSGIERWTECLQAECAWWDFERGCCCHKSIYLELDRLVAKKGVKP